MTRYVLLTVVAAAVGLLFALGMKAAFPAAPSPAPATAPVPVSACERALAANLAVADRALTDYQHGRARAGRDLWLSQTAALPVGCGR